MADRELARQAPARCDRPREPVRELPRDRTLELVERLRAEVLRPRLAALLAREVLVREVPLLREAPGFERLFALLRPFVILRAAPVRFEVRLPADFLRADDPFLDEVVGIDLNSCVP